MSDPRPDSRTEPRPLQVTVLAGLAILASSLMVLVAYDVLGQVESSDIRHEVEDYLTVGSGAGLTISADRMIEAMRIFTLVGGALSAAALVLAIYVLRRHNGARIGLTVISLLLLPSVLAVQGIGLLPVTLAGASLMLWSPSARRWFSGGRSTVSTNVAGMDDPRPSPGGDTPPEQPDANQPPAEPVAPPPPAATPYGQAPPPVSSSPAQYPPPGYAAATPPAPGQYPPPPFPYPGQGGYAPGGHPPGRPARPGTVVAAAVITWISAGLTLLGGVVLLAEVFFMRSLVVTQIEANAELSSRYSTDTILAIVGWISVGIVIWSAAAVGAAVFVFRGANWARAVLTFCAVSSGLLSMLMILAIFPVIWLAASVAAVWLLYVPSSNRYFNPGSAGGRPQVW